MADILLVSQYSYIDIENTFLEDRGRHQLRVTSWSVFLTVLRLLLLFQVFDILPLYSTLHPHESQKIQFTFYGHANISSQAVARCSVHGGPDYDIELLGQASLVQYFFDRQLVDYGKQVSLSCIKNIPNCNLQFIEKQTVKHI